MGESHSTRKLSDAVERAATSTSLGAVSGRYHKAPKKFEDDFTRLGIVLGTGSNGKVFLAKSNAGKAGASGKEEHFAVKFLRLIGHSHDDIEFENEVEIYLMMDHPHVARLYDVYETDSQLTIVMECMKGGELFKRVQKLKRFSEKDAADATWQMLLAISYLHSHKIAHRDIKPQNFLYDGEDSNHLKLIDFGFSKVCPDHHKMHASCGTLMYMAPEVLDGRYTRQCDMWSLGVAAFVLLFGYMPFSGEMHMQMSKIRRAEYKKKEDVWAKVSPTAQSFVEKLLIVDPNSRLTAEQALAHEWIAERDKMSLEQHNVDQGIVDSLMAFGQASHFRRACMCMMAWSLTNEEQMQVRDAFVELDANRSGTVTVSEFKHALEDNFHIDDEHAQAAFDALDATHHDEIFYSEFLAAMVATRIQMHDDLLRQTFKRFDTQNQGFITKVDLQKVLGQVYKGEELDRLLEEADVTSDGSADGKIDYDHFIHFIKHDGEDHHHEAACNLIDIEHQHPDSSHKTRHMRIKAAPAVKTTDLPVEDELPITTPKNCCSLQ